MRFLADVMLEKTARWLRMAGLDVEKPTVQDDELILMHAKKNRLILLTCDEELYKKSVLSEADALLVPDASFEKQVAFIAGKFDIPLPDDIEPARCPVCNGVLEIEKPKDAKDIVPAKVYKLHKKYWKCKDCGKVYWKGTHWDKISDTIKRIKKEK